MELFLVRHPRVSGGDGRCYGRLDLPLAHDPAHAAERLRRLLPAEVLAEARYYCSPASRCRALAACFTASAEIDQRLLEMHFGSWEGRLWEDIERSALDDWAANPLHFVPPNGETPHAVRTRALAWVADLLAAAVADPAAAERPVLAFSHAGPIRMLLSHWMQVEPEGWPRINIDFGSVSHLRLQNGRVQVISLNQ